MLNCCPQDSIQWVVSLTLNKKNVSVYILQELNYIKSMVQSQNTALLKSVRQNSYTGISSTHPGSHRGLSHIFGLTYMIFDTMFLLCTHIFCPKQQCFQVRKQAQLYEQQTPSHMRKFPCEESNLVNLCNCEPVALLSGRHHCHYCSWMLIFPILISQEKIRKFVSNESKISFHLCKNS